jgi:hypothetical protein
MVLMGQGRSEESHDAITQDLVHRALVAMYCCHHGVQGGI